jgi:hypothetical protein
MLGHKINQKHQHIFISQKSQNTSSQKYFCAKLQNAIHPPVYLLQFQITDFGSRNLHSTLSSDFHFILKQSAKYNSNDQIKMTGQMCSTCRIPRSRWGKYIFNLLSRNRKLRCGLGSTCSTQASINTVMHLRIPLRQELSWPSDWMFSWEGPRCMELDTSHYNL